MVLAEVESMAQCSAHVLKNRKLDFNSGMREIQTIYSSLPQINRRVNLTTGTRACELENRKYNIIF